jgi:rare lipoprotein A
VASWYGYPYHGRRAASGEIYDMEKLTAAHRTLPFGSLVRVENLENGRRVQVRINDRGPFVEGRIIDLSRAAARALGMLGPGTARVRLVLIGLPEKTEGGYFAVQTGAFRERANAERQRRDLRRRYGEVRIIPRDGDPVLWRVLVGREPTPEQAAALAERLRAEVGEAFVVRLDEPPGDHL